MSANGDRRSVATDALATLGTIIGEAEKRDAIHLAVEPVIAGEPLRPGDHITVTNGIAQWANPGEGLGIVDPFLPSRGVGEGQRFWFVMYPRMVHSLRHVWTHPAFPDESGTPAAAPEESSDAKAVSERWIRNFAEQLDQTYSRLMQAADLWVECGEYTYDNNEVYKDHYDKFPEFWTHYEIVRGAKVTADRYSFFTCSC